MQQEAAADTSGAATASAPPQEDGRHNGAREPGTFARRQLRLSPEAAAAVAALQAAGRGEPLSPRAVKLLSATDGLFLGIRWRVFGRHAYCAYTQKTLLAYRSGCPTPRAILLTNTLLAFADGNGQPRALLRGWVHFAAMVYATFVLRHTKQLGPWTLHPPAQRFAWWTYLGYVGSCVFHLVPYATLRSYQLALCFDFMCITCAHHTALCALCSRALFDPHNCPPLRSTRLAITGQIASLVGWLHPAAVISSLCSLAVFCVCCAGLASGSVMWQYRRHTRKTLMIVQVATSCIVEAVTIENKALAAVIAAFKVASFQWFAVFARYDAPRSSGLVVPGMWTDHDNFHVFACCTHALQVIAAAMQPVGV